MLGIFLHGGDLDAGGWIFIFILLALASAVVVAAFVGLIYLVGGLRGKR
jgi:hypothetical protein